MTSDHEKLKPHKLATIFPMMDEQAFAHLKSDISAHGQREPIVLFEGQILDGRNRYRACLELGREPKFVEFDGVRSALDLVMSLNFHRRHLNESQRAMVAAKAIKASGLKAAEWLRGSIDPEQERINLDRAAKIMNVSRPSVVRARRVVTRGVPELAEAVERGELAVGAAAEVARERPDVQKQILQRGPRAAAGHASERRRKASAKGTAGESSAGRGRIEIGRLMGAIGKVHRLANGPLKASGW